MAFTADLHLHSRYAYACSKLLDLTNMAAWARLKGIDLLSSSDFTHPAWFADLEENLKPAGDGFYEYGGVRFVLGSELSCVYQQGDRSRRVHLLVFAPDLDTVRGIREMLTGQGTKLNGDGRPTVRVSARDLTARLLDLNDACMVVPAHIWTPWYGMLGSKSGFDSLEECFSDMAPNIHAVETGLSSDPEMNWRVPSLEGKTIVSFSDAHSLPNMGRELTVFEGDASYGDLAKGLKGNRVERTLEFFPQEGKYHLNGHRKCDVIQRPDETHRTGTRCPECGRPLTLGVLHRVEALADDEASPDPNARRPFLRLVPLVELIAQIMGKGRSAKSVGLVYRQVCEELGGEVQVLTLASFDDIELVAGEALASAVSRVRAGQVDITPGFDGRYGTVRPAL